MTDSTPPASPHLRLVRPAPAPSLSASAPRVTPLVCERVPMASIQGALALDTLLSPTPSPAPAPPLRLVPRPDGATAFAAPFAHALVETLAGRRPASQLARLCTTRVFQQVHRRAALAADPRSGVSGVALPRVRSVHVAPVAAGVAEVSVHVRHGQRSRAIAARVEHLRGRWVCTALEVG